ncbi:cytidylate kinase-like family protein [Peptoniphilus equinus]|uniref:Cytidylate kinase-like family protein n=1 Tax=Peptoniphilus equinus TaxID=3016343 RepID=A0ABY7QUK0_9FIRM|nr:cytidylate kinase-like family protein [Peptoniphilus equinus]WBW49853.1 cytidylate kinase-like family protein [Peptoniphilus equinus]
MLNLNKWLGAHRPVIFTIDREHGTDAMKVAKRIADKLDIPVYDEQIIDLKLLESSVDPNCIKKDDTFLQGTIYDLYRENYSYSQEDFVATDARFLANAKILRDLAKDGAAVILGKCANYVLKGYDTFNVFLSCDETLRIERLMARDHISQQKARGELLKIDTRRKNHYQKYTGGQWGGPTDYDLIINTAYFDSDDVANVILKCSALKHRQ